MTKSELIKTVAKQASLTEAQTNEAVKALTDVITAALAKGEKVQLPGLFTAETVERPARNGRNPRTGESMTIPAHKAVKISASSTLKKPSLTERPLRVVGSQHVGSGASRHRTPIFRYYARTSSRMTVTSRS
ncbi:DNA-binding protein HU [Cutibacterium acnes JCM 18920]|nr:DNA-binding protein HU [Cutibacterium acnes JCM 18920]